MKQEIEMTKRMSFIQEKVKGRYKGRVVGHYKTKTKKIPKVWNV